MAINARDAMNKEKDIKVDEVWIDDDWKKQNPEVAVRKTGYNTGPSS